MVDVVESIRRRSVCIGRAIKRAVLDQDSRQICGRRFKLAYETRGHAVDDDLSALTELCQRVTCALDIGANVGLASLVMASAMPPGGRVVAFEASEASANVLRRNVSLNELKSDVQVFNGVVSDANGALCDFMWDHDAGNASAVIAPPSGRSQKLTKPTITVDSVVAHWDLSPQLCKIDVEGGEVAVLNGMSRTLQQFRPVISVEVHGAPELPLRSNFGQILELFTSHEYVLRELITQNRLASFADVEPFCEQQGDYQRLWVLATPQ